MFSPIVDFLCRCAGTRRDAIKHAPEGRAAAGTLGLLMLLTSLLAMFNGGYAVFRMFYGRAFDWPAAVFFGIVWGLVVFSLDRLLILGMDKFASPPRVALQVLVRLPLAAAIALVISKPMLLNICESILDRQLMVERRSVTNDERAANATEAGIAEQKSILDKIDGERDRQQERLRKDPDSARFRAATEDLDRLEREHGQLVAITDRQVTRARQELLALTLRPPPVVPDPAASAQAAERRSELLRQIAGWRRDVRRSESAVTAARNEVDAARLEWQGEEEKQLSAIEAERTEAHRHLEGTTAAVQQRDVDSEREVRSALRPDLINQYRTLRRIMNDPRNPDASTTSIFSWAIDLLFFLLELTPILIKAFARRTPLDDAVRTLEEAESAGHEARRVALIERTNLATVTAVKAHQSANAAAQAVIEAYCERVKQNAIDEITKSNAVPHSSIVEAALKAMKEFRDVVDKATA